MSKLLPLSHGQHAIVDDSDWEAVSPFKWYCSKNGYVVSGMGKSVPVYLHRFLMGFPKGKMVDHINGDKLDCRRSNMRLCTNQQNTWNNRRTYSEFGLRGIRLIESGTWSVRLKDKHLGCFTSLRLAIEAYNQEVISQRGEYGVTLVLTDYEIAEIEKEALSRSLANRSHRPLNRTNRSGFRGVARCRYGWRAVIKVDYQQIHLGSFEDAEEAAYIYDQAALQLFGDKARLNLLSHLNV